MIQLELVEFESSKWIWIWDRSCSLRVSKAIRIFFYIIASNVVEVKSFAIDPTGSVEPSMIVSIEC